VGLRLTFSFILIGTAAVATGFVGMLLPSGERLAAALALVVGAGMGVVSLAAGSQVVADTQSAYENLFLVSTSLGFAASIFSLAVLWRRTRREVRIRRETSGA
jgi:hypothetical protein